MILNIPEWTIWFSFGAISMFIIVLAYSEYSIYKEKKTRKMELVQGVLKRNFDEEE